jgi:BTB/POZ domain
MADSGDSSDDDDRSKFGPFPVARPDMTKMPRAPQLPNVPAFLQQPPGLPTIPQLPGVLPGMLLPNIPNRIGTPPPAAPPVPILKDFPVLSPELGVRRQIKDEVNMLPFYNSPLYSDVTIKVEDTTFHAHRLILHRSEYFEKLFASNMVENVDKKITSVKIDGVSASCMEIFLRYLYGDALQTLTFEECITLFRETDAFLVPSFRNRLVEIMNNHHNSNMSVRDTIIYLETIATYRLPLNQLGQHDYNVPVIYSLSYEAVLHLILPTKSYAYIPMILWIATHPNATPEQVKTLLSYCEHPKVNETELNILCSYQEIPVLTRFIIETLRQSVIHHSKVSSALMVPRLILSLTVLYPELIVLKDELDKGITTIDTIPTPKAHSIGLRVLCIRDYPGMFMVQGDNMVVRPGANESVLLEGVVDINGKLQPASPQDKDRALALGISVKY